MNVPETAFVRIEYADGKVELLEFPDLPTAQRHAYSLDAKRRSAGITRVEMFRENIVCDFCSQRPVEWTYHVQAGTEIQSVIGWASADDWAACDVCKNFIEADEWIELAMRAGEKFQETYGIKPHPDQFLPLWQEFRRVKVGVPERVSGDDPRAMPTSYPAKDDPRG